VRCAAMASAFSPTTSRGGRAYAPRRPRSWW
jgi:hypothetical protein